MPSAVIVAFVVALGSIVVVGFGMFVVVVGFGMFVVVDVVAVIAVVRTRKSRIGKREVVWPESRTG